MSVSDPIFELAFHYRQDMDMTAWTHEGTLAALGADATALAGQPSFAGNTQVGSMRAAPVYRNCTYGSIACLYWALEVQCLLSQAAIRL